MAACKNDIINWWENGIKLNFSHMMIICDTYDYSDYPLYTNDPQKERNEIMNDPQMRQIMEVYSYKLDFNMQLNERRTIHYE